MTTSTVPTPYGFSNKQSKFQSFAKAEKALLPSPRKRLEAVVALA